MIGINFVEVGTTNGTTTDLDGNFTLAIEGENSMIEFSYIGHKNQVVQAGNKRVFRIVLEKESGLYFVHLTGKSGA